MNYQQRLNQLLTYINSHLDDELTVEELSRQACLSKYHFHRQFQALFGINVGDYIKQLRLKKASYLLAYRCEVRILDVALVSGYQSAEAFSRAFKASFEQSPSHFRLQPQWPFWFKKYQWLTTLRNEQMKKDKTQIEVNIIEFNETKVAILAHRGAPELIGNSIVKFIQWRKANKLPPKISATFNLVYDDPDNTPSAQYRFDLCAVIQADVKENDFGVNTGVIPGGRCAVFRHIGPDEMLRAGIEYLYEQWLSDSGEQLRDFPLYFQRVSFFPDVPEEQMVTDVFLPLL